MAKDIFERLNKGRPPQPETVRHEPPPEQRLLDWLRHHWGRPTIRLRDICYAAPNVVRKREHALKATETLVQHGWLAPVKPARRDRYEWRITQGLDLSC